MANYRSQRFRAPVQMLRQCANRVKFPLKQPLKAPKQRFFAAHHNLKRVPGIRQIIRFQYAMLSVSFVPHPHLHPGNKNETNCSAGADCGLCGRGRRSGAAQRDAPCGLSASRWGLTGTEVPAAIWRQSFSSKPASTSAPSRPDAGTIRPSFP
ncbi:hypothetical protein [Paraburkholderia phosphatilytica]|uniref:hypothetical protein n=1 Tax=Paraburkholderia phosphatilytica TaxID=2282883 RepID=UPI000F5EB437|nr:hypothetical protein [Paraburkholderia phosphatilytica]